MREKHSILFYSSILIFLLAIFSIGNLIGRHQSLVLLIAFGSTFMTYFFLIKESNSFRLLIGLGIFCRLMLFFSLPSLSDDIYRFIWDGTLLKNGIHPFDNLPVFYLDYHIPGITQELFDKLNSPEYFTIYPPINQFIFWLSATIGNGNWLVSANVIRSIHLVADIGSLWFLIQLIEKYNTSSTLAFWFFLNPLVILEFTGNLHFEGLVLFFLLAGIYWMEKSRIIWSGLGFGLAIGTKLLPFIFLPFLFLHGLKSKKWSIAIIGGLVAILTLIPMFSDSFIAGMKSSLNLYFQKFEFNASLYFIAREIGFSMYGFNRIVQIGPILSMLSLLSILGISVVGVIKKWSIPKAFLFILLVYLLFATTVHPWYVVPLIAFGILSGYYFPIIWSFIIFITYLGYTKNGFELPMTWIVIEYVVVTLALIVELKGRKIRINLIQ